MSLCKCGARLKQQKVKSASLTYSRDTEGTDDKSRTGILAFSSSTVHHSIRVQESAKAEVSTFADIAYCDSCGRTIDASGEERLLGGDILVKPIYLQSPTAIRDGQHLAHDPCHNAIVGCSKCGEPIPRLKKREGSLDLSRTATTTHREEEESWWGLSSSTSEWTQTSSQAFWAEATMYNHGMTCGKCGEFVITAGYVLTCGGDVSLLRSTTAPREFLQVVTATPAARPALLGGPPPSTMVGSGAAAEKRRQQKESTRAMVLAHNRIHAAVMSVLDGKTSLMPHTYRRCTRLESDLASVCAFLWCVYCAECGMRKVWIVHRAWVLKDLCEVCTLSVKEFLDKVLPRDPNNDDVYVFGGPLFSRAVLDHIRYAVVRVDTMLGVNMSSLEHARNFQAIYQAVGLAVDAAHDHQWVALPAHARPVLVVPVPPRVLTPTTALQPSEERVSLEQRSSHIQNSSGSISHLGGILGGQSHQAHRSEVIVQRHSVSTAAALPAHLIESALLHEDTARVRRAAAALATVFMPEDVQRVREFAAVDERRALDALQQAQGDVRRAIANLLNV